MSSLEYLDGKGTVKNFTLVPWKTLNQWLSALNGNPHIAKDNAKGVNRGKVLEELESRRLGKGPLLNLIKSGCGCDWRDYENDQGLTHLEELLVYQPKDWRKQAREYKFRYQFDLGRKSHCSHKSHVRPAEGSTVDVDGLKSQVGTSMSTGCRTMAFRGKHIFMEEPIHLVMLCPELNRAARYEPLNFLLSYEVGDPIPELTKDMSETERIEFLQALSPLDYFIQYQKYVDHYDTNKLLAAGKRYKCPRLCLINELDYSNIVGQRMAKQMIRRAVLSFVINRFPKNSFCSSHCKPLSLIFAGPSGNGKTELAKWLSELLNKPDSNYYHKVDCGKLTHANEMFGMSGAFIGSHQGSALNNFVTMMSMNPDAIGIVLLDEIEKAGQDVIHSLYQVLDKGEWTNKKLGRAHQTEVIPCHNIIFIMTTNACDKMIDEFAAFHKDITLKSGDEFQKIAKDFESRLRNTLSSVSPFTDAFIGRIGKAVPFFPISDGDPDEHPLIQQEMMTVIKVIIEKEQEKHSDSINTIVTPQIKHQMAVEILQKLHPQAGVRSVEKLVKSVMSEELEHLTFLSEGGIEKGSAVQYFVRGNEIDMLTKQRGSNINETNATEHNSMNDIWD